MLHHNNNSTRKTLFNLVIGVCILTLAACGGSGGSDDFNVGSGTNNGSGDNGSSNTADGLLISTDRTTINQDQTARITVVARSQSNVAQPGVEVFFGASDGLLRVERSLTNEFGEASAILSARGARVGTLINVFATTANGRRVDIDPDIQVITGSGSPSAAFNVTGPLTLPQNATGNYTATLTDSSQTGVANRNVSIQVIPDPNSTGGQTLGQVNPNTTATDANGLVNFTYTPPNDGSGTAFIRINTTDASPNASRVLSVSVGQGLSISGPSDIQAGSIGTFTATLVNASAAPVSGQSINLSSNRGTIASSNATTNNSGQVDFTLNTQAADGDNTATITVTAPNVSPVATSTLNVSITGTNTGPTNGAFTFPQNGETFDINRFNRAGFNLPGGPSAVGQPVTITASRGQIGNDAETPTNPAQSQTFTTDGAGNVTFRFASAEGGPATFTASGSGASAQLNVMFVPSPSTISFATTPTSITTGQAATLVATIRDSSGNLLPGTDVNFFIDFDGSGGGGNALSEETATTDAQGQARVTFTAGPNTGTVSLRAAIPQGAGQNLQLPVTQAAAGGGGASFTFVDKNGQFTLNEGNAISFNLEGGASAANQPVTITTTLGQVDDNLNSDPAAAASRTFTTNGAGDISFQAISSMRGPATITASGPGGASAETAVEFIGTPGSVSVQPTSQTIAPNQPLVITATVLDSSGAALESVPVNFVIDNDNSGGNRTPESAQTNSQGRASTTFTAGPTTGDVGIRATADNGRLAAGTQVTVANAADNNAPRARSIPRD